MALSAEVDKRRFEAGLDAGDFSLIDVSFFALACR